MTIITIIITSVMVDTPLRIILDSAWIVEFQTEVETDQEVREIYSQPGTSCQRNLLIEFVYKEFSSLLIFVFIFI
jgi:hypothetical protein